MDRPRGWGRARCVESSGLPGRASSYCVGASASQYSCVPEPCLTFLAEGAGREPVRSLGASAPESLPSSWAWTLSRVIGMAAVPPGLIRKGFLKEASEEMVCGDEPGPRRPTTELGWGGEGTGARFWIEDVFITCSMGVGGGYFLRNKMKLQRK